MIIVRLLIVTLLLLCSASNLCLGQVQKVNAEIHNVSPGMFQDAVERVVGKPLNIEAGNKASAEKWFYEWGSIYFSDDLSVAEVRGFPLEVTIPNIGKRVIFPGTSKSEVVELFAGIEPEFLTDLDLQFRLDSRVVQLSINESGSVEACRLLGKPFL